MRILYIIPNLQHPRVRGPHRHYHFIKELSQRHAITLLTLVRNTVVPEALAEIKSYTENLFPFNVNGHSENAWAGRFRKVPMLGARLENSVKLRGGLQAMKARFLELADENQFDVVCFHGKSVFSVIADWEGLPIVTDFCDATSMRIRSSLRFNSPAKAPLYYAKSIRMRHLERRLIEKSDQVAFISKRDREAVLGCTDCSPILPLGVDTNFWQRKAASLETKCLVFTGVMDYAPNHDAAVHLIKTIFPKIQERVKNARLCIVGRSPKDSLLQIAKQNPAVSVTGFVDDVRPYLEQAAVFVAPVRFASGTQNKVLEAMAMQLPVVTTEIVSEGLVVDDQEQPPALAAKDDSDFAAKVASILEDKDCRERLAKQGRLYVEKHFNWSNSASKLEALLERAVADHQHLSILPE